MRTAYDAIVIGVGGMGSATCYHLARHGVDVLGLEQFTIGHDRGSSHGQTRIIRKAYFEHPDYVPLLHRAYELWGDLEREAATTLFDRCGLMLAGPPRGAVISGVARAAEIHGLAIERLRLAELQRRFPMFIFADDWEGLFESDAGFLHVEACVHAHADVARRRGATILENRAVRAWQSARHEIAVETDDARFTARSLVVCGGAWAARLLADYRFPLTVRRKVLLWLESRDGRYGRDLGVPVFAFDTRDGFFYGFPEIENGLVKVALHTGGAALASADELALPDAAGRLLRESDVAPVFDFVRRHMPGLAPVVRRHAVCMYTMTPDEHFIIDRHPRHENVLLAAGFSGHGFKFCPVVGEILADFVTGGRTNAPIEFLRASRPALR